MAYGFKLTSLTEIPSDTPSIVMTLITGETSITKTLTRYENPPLVGWIDDLENPSALLLPELELGEYYELTIYSFDETDVGDEYAINLSLPEAPTQAFTEAVGMVMSPLELHDPPTEFYTLIGAALTSAIPDVITADGKFCSIHGISWNYSDAVDKAAYEEFENEIINIASHPEIPAYTAGLLITDKPTNINSYGVGGVSYNYSFSGYEFIYSFRYHADTNPQTRALSYDVTAALITPLS